MSKTITENRRSYTVSALNDGFEITMYGEIVETQPLDWWTGKPIEGSFIIQNDFLKDLDTIVSAGAKKLKVRMNSVGGDCAVSLLIHNRLRELAESMEISCIVDGVAMSGGSLIMCACNNVSVNPASLIMIHKAMGSFRGYYNADEIRSRATELDAWDKAQIEVYKRKSKLSDTIISHMMSSTTFMTGAEAVEKGFADTIIEDAEPLTIAASANKTSLYINGRELPLRVGMIIPENIPTVAASSEEVINILPVATGDKGGILMAKNLEELRAENPELAAQVENDVKAASSAEMTNAANAAAEAERKRLAAIDEIASLYDEETVRKAKYDEPCTAQEMAFRAAIAAKKSGSAFMQNLENDYAASGASKISAIPGVADVDDKETKSPEVRMAEARANVKSLLHPDIK